MKRQLFSVVSALLITACLCGCGNDAVVPVKSYESSHKTAFMQSGIAASNQNWQLKLDAEYYRVLLQNVKTGEVWSTLPSELLKPRIAEDGFEEINNPQLENPLIVEYVENDTVQIEYLYAYTGSLKKGDYSIENIKDGLKITYYFGSKNISVPVEYRLLDDGINISVDPKEITEDDTRIYRISVAPFFCSVKNEDENSYIFYPSGSGTLIYASQHIADSSYRYSYPVYGKDLQLLGESNEELNNSESVRLPVFGAKSGDKAVCAIIEDGSESAYIDLNVGSSTYGYSSVYASFELRGLSASGSYSEGIVQNKLSVSFYPMTGEKASYTGFAEKYREYLLENGLSEKKDERVLSIKLLGGTYIRSDILGIPYQKLYSLTSVSNAEEIIREIYENTSVAPVVNLVGYGEAGLNVGCIAGNYRISEEFGTENDFSSFTEYCDKIGAGVYMDYDIIRFSSSGGGVKKISDYATDTTGQRAMSRRTELGSGTVSSVKEYFVKREMLFDIAENVISANINAGIDGVSLSTASAYAYSDYSSQKYFSKSGFASDFKNIAEHIRSEGQILLSDNANAYAAANADFITCAPTVSDQNILFDADVPFYQMVFKGYVPMTCDALNLASDDNFQLLRAAESGCGISYTVISEFDNRLLEADQKIFYASVYGNLKNKIQNTVSEYNEYFEKISSAKIASHEVINQNVRKTVFDNGIAVYVNYGVREETVENIRIDAKSYIYRLEETR